MTHTHARTCMAHTHARTRMKRTHARGLRPNRRSRRCSFVRAEPTVTAQAYSPLTRGYQIDDAAQAAVAAKCALASNQAKAQTAKAQTRRAQSRQTKRSNSASRTSLCNAPLPTMPCARVYVPIDNGVRLRAAHNHSHARGNPRGADRAPEHIPLAL